MKLKPEYIITPYVVNATKRIEERTGSSMSSLILRLTPRFSSLFTGFQEIEIERTIQREMQKVNPYEQFIIESTKILNRYILEFDSNKLPFNLVDHKRIWKTWLGYADLLTSKYAGSEVDSELGYMTTLLGNKKELLSKLVNDYPLKELFGRGIHKLKFDKKGECNREWDEIISFEKMKLTQQCYLSYSNQEEILKIVGKSDSVKNSAQMEQMCKRSNVQMNDMCIEQKTVYSGKNLALIPNLVSTEFMIRAGGEILRKETIMLVIEKG